jgi:hypothetical protein
MTKYTVIAAAKAEGDLARLWLQGSDRAAVAHAADLIDQMLKDDAPHRGCNSVFGMRQLIVSPFVVEFSVNEPDRIVTIWSFQHVGEITNGH